MSCEGNDGDLSSIAMINAEQVSAHFKKEGVMVPSYSPFVLKETCFPWTEVDRLRPLYNCITGAMRGTEASCK